MKPNRPITAIKVLSLRTELDPVLSVVAPLGLAAAGDRPCLLIDLDENGPSYPGRRSLADLVAEGPNRVELVPGLDPRHSSGVAVLRNGGATWPEAADVVEELIKQWPAVVLRLPPLDIGLPFVWKVVPVVPLLPGLLAPEARRAAVWQALNGSKSPPGPGPVLPPLSRHLLSRLLSGRWEPRGRWVNAWRPVWELPWPQ